MPSTMCHNSHFGSVNCTMSNGKNVQTNNKNLAVSSVLLRGYRNVYNFPNWFKPMS